MNKNSGRHSTWSRRAWLGNVAKLTGAGVGASMFGFEPGLLREIYGQATGARGGRGAAAATPGTHLIMLGTQGGPGVNLARGQTGNVLVVDGQPYLVDCGYGTVRSLVEAGITLN